METKQHSQINTSLLEWILHCQPQKSQERTMTWSRVLNAFSFSQGENSSFRFILKWNVVSGRITSPPCGKFIKLLFKVQFKTREKHPNHSEKWLDDNVLYKSKCGAKKWKRVSFQSNGKHFYRVLLKMCTSQSNIEILYNSSLEP